jgi:hypothetical protein
MTEKSSGAQPGPVRASRWRPTYTPTEMRQLFGVPRQAAAVVTGIAAAAVEHHRALGTERHAWEPTAQHDEQLAGPYLRQADTLVEDRATHGLDPLLDDLAHGAEHVKALLEDVASHPGSLTTPESGTTLPGDEAGDLVVEHDRSIESDFADGKTHHVRSSGWLMLLSRGAPWLESVGFLAFVTYFLNVPLLSPQDDPLAWSFATSVVVVVVLGQTWFVHHGARAHNQARESSAQGNRHEAERSYRRRNRHLVAALLTAAGMTGGLIDRGVVTLGDADAVTTWVIVSLALVTGVVLPALAYLALAFDGSKVSRERDAVADALRADHAEHAALVAEVRAALEHRHEVGGLLRTKHVPDILSAARAALDEVAPLHNLLRLQIGGLTGPGPARPARVPVQGAVGLPADLSTGLPGVRTVDLRPVADRLDRLRALDDVYDDLERRLAALPSHPWTRIGRAGPDR